MMIIFKWLTVISLFTIIIAFTTHKHKQQLVSFERDNIEISEKTFLNQDILFEFIEKSNLISDGVSLHTFHLNNLEEYIEQHPLIKCAEVFASQKGVLRVNIEPRKAIVRIITDSSTYYLDEDMKIMPTSNEYTARVLVVSGDVGLQHHHQIFNFLEIIEKNEFWKSQITQLYFINDEVILIPRVGDQRVHFGLLTNISAKLDNLYQFYMQAMPVKGWQTYSDISLKYSNQLVCTKK